MPLLYPLLPLQGTQSILRGEAHQAGGHDLVLVLPLQDHHQVQLVEKTSREGVDFPEIWLCPSPSFSFQRLANLGYMYIYLYLVCQLSSMSCWQFFSRQVNNYFRGRSKSDGNFRFQEIRKVQVICPKKVCPTGHCTGKRQLDISCWKLYNSILRVTKWMKTSHLLSTQSTSWPEWTPDFFLVSSWTNVITTKWWFNTHPFFSFSTMCPMLCRVLTIF